MEQEPRRKTNAARGDCWDIIVRLQGQNSDGGVDMLVLMRFQVGMMTPLRSGLEGTNLHYSKETV